MRLFQQVTSGIVLAAFAAGAHSQANAPKDATETTRAANQAYLATLPMGDKQSFDDARRGFIDGLGDQTIMGADGRPAWSLKGYEFLSKEKAPDTVNPALWRHARVNMGAGLFKVTDGIYQLRGFDLSNMTVIEGKTGLILVDPLITTESAKAALELYYKHRPRKPVVSVIYSHSHADHFGGVRGVVSGADVASGKVSIIAPAGFMEEAVGENVIAGNAMSRRGIYQFGPLLPRGEKGQVDAGLGKSISFGTVSLIPPTVLIEKKVETHTVDGVDIVFELTPGAEAPSEMIMYYPQFKVLNMTEIAAQTMHNLLPMRGALVRDPLVWSKHLGGALERYGAKSDVMIAQHNWPVWGADRVQGFLKKQRDTYKYVHDQTVRLMNHGHVGSEIADTLKMPASLSQDWSTHGFYGDLKHNIKAVYQRYLGYYDGNPANLYALPPVPAAQKTIEYMGGAPAVLQRARADFAKGEYRWVAQMTSQLVFADPTNQEARGLAADAYEQLGYQAESSTARNALLQGAWELRNGLPKMPAVNTQAPDVIRALTLDMFFDYLGVRLNGEKAAGKTTVLNWQFTDTKQNYVLNLENSALTYVAGAQSANADATLTLTRATLDEISLQKTTFPAALQAGLISVTGKREKVGELLGMLDTFPNTFPLIEPRPAAH
ncbi:alkyl sulfatase dimerization domain-containing protein [Variovorax sp. J22R133]|uniref:alkyl/aryl-sulfatase n=1 Tax=Variovorax brevis TaxID=3053503 RepID=UPI0025761AAD|nr:alkyl sulfatase dimerization domain-containing protein [Variovorax sp. J22R133]MDM0112359.1 alkyl sulfatase dimerization domain-containing protein [Variovorax sp. J22R133]